jgi:hypothetical protein
MGFRLQGDTDVLGKNANVGTLGARNLEVELIVLVELETKVQNMNGSWAPLHFDALSGQLVQRYA